MKSHESKEFATGVLYFERLANWMSKTVRRANSMSNIEISRSGHAKKQCWQKQIIENQTRLNRFQLACSAGWSANQLEVFLSYIKSVSNIFFLRQNSTSHHSLASRIEASCDIDETASRERLPNRLMVAWTLLCMHVVWITCKNVFCYAMEMEEKEQKRKYTAGASK